MKETDPVGSQSRCAKYMCSNNDFTAEVTAVMAGARYSASTEAACIGGQAVLQQWVAIAFCHTLNQVL